MTESKPCPFCGSDDVNMFKNTIVGGYQIVCADCVTHGPAGNEEKEAERLWNEREKGETHD